MGAGLSCTSQRYAPDEESGSLRRSSSGEDSECRSVRAIALKNHSRQGMITYMPQEEISSHLIQRIKSVNSDSFLGPAEESDYNIVAVVKAKSKTIEEVLVLEDVNSDELITDDKPTSVTPSNSLTTVKNVKNFELTINLGDDHGWAQVHHTDMH